MNEQKNLLIILGEWWQQRQALRQPDSEGKPSKRLSHLFPTPGNIIFTMLVLGGLLFA